MLWLNQAVVDSQVLPWVQDLANNVTPPATLSLDYGLLTPAGDTWQDDARVLVEDQGGTYQVAVTMPDGLVSVYTIQPQTKG